MKLIEKLKAIRALIDTPEKWTQDVFARDKDGVGVSLHGPDAACFCLQGAWRNICPDEWFGYHTLADELPDGFSNLTDFNDAPSTTHADVMALVDRAIAAEQAV